MGVPAARAVTRCVALGLAAAAVAGVLGPLLARGAYLVVDSDYCSSRGGLYTQSCLNVAIAAVQDDSSYDVIELAAGVWSARIALSQPINGNLLFTSGPGPGRVLLNSTAHSLYIVSGVHDVAVVGIDFTGNNAGAANPGVIFVSFCSNITVSDTTIMAVNRFAPGDGGCIMAKDVDGLFLNDATVQGPCQLSLDALGVGAGMAITRSVATLRNVTVADTDSLGDLTTRLGGAMYLEDSVVYASLFTSTNTAAFTGGSILVKNSSLALTDSWLDTGTAVEGAGLLAVWSGSSVSLLRTTLTNGYSLQDSGAMCIGLGTRVNVTDSVISHSRALSVGGGVGACPLTMGDAPVFTMTRSTVEHCVAASSGGMLVIGSVTNIRDSVIRGNTALAGEAGLALSVDVGSPAATLDNVTVENNVAQNGDGGGVAIWGPTRVSNCVIRNNSASSFASLAGSGGGMFVFNSNLTIIGTLFDSNTASADGGGLDIYSDSQPVTLRDCVFSNNTGLDGGGAAHRGLGSYTNVHFEGNTARDEGGGLVVGFLFVSEVVVRNSTFVLNTANGTGGGAVWARGSARLIDVTCLNNTAPLGIAGAVGCGRSDGETGDECNVVGSKVVGGYALYGGAFSASNGEMNVTECNVTNSAAQTGGAAYVPDGVVLRMTGVRINATAASDSGGGLAVGGGGTALLDRVEFGRCSAGTSGGGVAISSGGRVVASNNTAVWACEALGRGGGGVLFSGWGARLDGEMTVDGCRSQLVGGGVLAELPDGSAAGGDFISIGRLTLRNNTAGTVGGGLALTSLRSGDTGPDAIAISGLVVTGNTAFQGGGISTDMSAGLAGVVVDGNSATSNGGGVAVVDDGCRMVNVTLVGSTLRDNVADIDGGGLFVAAAEVAIADTVMANNTAGRDGGGLAGDCAVAVCTFGLRSTCDGLGVVADNMTLSGNVAGGDGGGARLGSIRFATVGGVGLAARDNQAQRGGGVFADLDTEWAVGAITVGGNVASTYGPGVASPPAQTLWTVSPEAAGAGGEVMSGAPLCAETGGCALAVEDGFANVATVPTVVQLSAVPGFLLGQQYVLVEDGTSGTMEGLAVVLPAAPAPGPGGVESEVGARILGTDASAATAVTVSLTGCDPGFGTAAAAGSSGLVCVPCPADTYNDGAGSWEACRECAPGSATPGGGGASSCDWCAAGYGYDDGGGGGGGGGGCVLCEAGTFSNASSLQTPCRGCGSGLSTAGAGSTECTVAATGVGLAAIPWFVWASIGGAFLVCLVAAVWCASRRTKRKVMGSYYIDEDATVTIDEKHLTRKVTALLNDGYTKRIGGGEFTDIYRVREKKDVFVLKLLKTKVEGSATARAEFEKERSCLVALSARVHPGVIRARFFTTSSPVSIGLDYCPGGTLKDYLVGNDLSKQSKLRICTQVASGLTFIHSKSIAHLDLKTTNILLTKDKEAVIADFGISRQYGDRSRRSRTASHSANVLSSAGADATSLMMGSIPMDTMGSMPLDSRTSLAFGERNNSMANLSASSFGSFDGSGSLPAGTTAGRGQGQLGSHGSSGGGGGVASVSSMVTLPPPPPPPHVPTTGEDMTSLGSGVGSFAGSTLPTLPPTVALASSGSAGSGTGSLRDRTGTLQDLGEPDLAFTPQYCAPERLLRSSLTFDELLAADVYSFGVVTWVVYTQSEPFAGVSGDEVVQRVRMDPGFRHALPVWMDGAVAEVVGRCWEADGAARPMMLEAAHALARVYTEEPYQGQLSEVYMGEAIDGVAVHGGGGGARPIGDVAI